LNSLFHFQSPYLAAEIKKRSLTKKTPAAAALVLVVKRNKKRKRRSLNLK